MTAWTIAMKMISGICIDGDDDDDSPRYNYSTTWSNLTSGELFWRHLPSKACDITPLFVIRYYVFC
jgi:hypothetical protein